MSDRAADVAWMRELRERVQAWLRADDRGPANTTHQTPAYVDAIFAFGLAKLGEVTQARCLMDDVRLRLADGDGAHQFLLRAYTASIEDAIVGRPHKGANSAESARLSAIDLLLGYVVDRMRKQSRILEPAGNVNPYRPHSQQISASEKRLGELNEESRPDVFEKEVRKWLDSREGHTPQIRPRILSLILARHVVAGPELTRDTVRSILANPPRKGDESGEFIQYLRDLTHALRAVAHFHLSDLIGPLSASVKGSRIEHSGPVAWLLPQLETVCVEAFVALDLPEEADQFLNEVSRLILGDCSLGEWAAKSDPLDPIQLQSLLAVADGWYRFGWDTLADPVLSRARQVLRVNALNPRELRDTAVCVVRAVRSASRPKARDHFRLLFEGMPFIRDTYTTASHFYAGALEFAESICLTAVEVCSHS